MENNFIKLIFIHLINKQKKSRDLKSLSGGERSFSTVAFLLSLWSIVESPILFLDEFDVFMVIKIIKHQVFDIKYEDKN